MDKTKKEKSPVSVAGAGIIEKRAFSSREAAVYLGVSDQFLRVDRCDGYREGRTPGPEYFKIGRLVRYLREDLDAWLDLHQAAFRGRSSGVPGSAG